MFSGLYKHLSAESKERVLEIRAADEQEKLVDLEEQVHTRKASHSEYDE